MLLSTAYLLENIISINDCDLNKQKDAHFSTTVALGNEKILLAFLYQDSSLMFIDTVDGSSDTSKLIL